MHLKTFLITRAAGALGSDFRQNLGYLFLAHFDVAKIHQERSYHLRGEKRTSILSLF